MIQRRIELQQLMHERFEAVIGRATGRRVIGFMSGNQHQPEMMCDVFILAPTETLQDVPAGTPPVPAD